MEAISLPTKDYDDFYEKGQLLGSGAYGSVFKVKRKSDS